MPYIPKVIARRGMGQAPCPSMNQLMGINDPTDPCQSAGITNTQLSDIKNFFYQAGVDSATPDTTSALPSWLLPAGIGLIVFVLIAGGRR